MIVCGWCGYPTPADCCVTCGRDPLIPYTQRNLKPPKATDNHEPGRPKLDAGQVRARVRIALKELGDGATLAALAERLDVSETTARKWRKVAGL